MTKHYEHIPYEQLRQDYTKLDKEQSALLTQLNTTRLNLFSKERMDIIDKVNDLEKILVEIDLALDKKELEMKK